MHGDYEAICCKGVIRGGLYEQLPAVCTLHKTARVVVIPHSQLQTLHTLPVCVKQVLPMQSTHIWLATSTNLLLAWPSGAMMCGGQVPWAARGVSAAPIDGLMLGPLMGKGSFGRVYRGIYKGAPCAVKVGLVDS